MLKGKVCATALLVFAIGCASSSQGKAPSSSAAITSRESDVITADELLNPNVIGGSALEAVRRLRPRFLTSRGSGSIRSSDAGSVHVSLDGGALQSVSFLSRMRPAEIAEIRFLSANQAAQQFGTSSGTGSVMLIKSK